MMNDNLQKWLTKAELLKIINSLPDNVLLEPNEVRNIAIREGVEEFKFLGFINFLDGTVQWWEE